MYSEKIMDNTVEAPRPPARPHPDAHARIRPKTRTVRGTVRVLGDRDRPSFINLAINVLNNEWGTNGRRIRIHLRSRYRLKKSSANRNSVEGTL